MAFEDFLQLNYNTTKHKIRKIREVLNRMDISFQQKPFSIYQELNKLITKINNLEDTIVYLPKSIGVGSGEDEEPTPPPSNPLPDLIIESITDELFSNYIQFLIKVKNIGTASSGNCNLSILLDDNITNLSIPPLEINESVTLNHQYSFNPSGSPISKSLVATADSTNVITELNENNNSKSITFDTKTPPVGVIIHCHNPEGKEIGTITDISAPILNHGLLAPTLTNGLHGVAQFLSPGIYTITTTFNGISVNKNLTVEAGNNYELTYVFDRTSMNLSFSFGDTRTISGTVIGPPLGEDDATIIDDSDSGSCYDTLLDATVRANGYAPAGSEVTYEAKSEFTISLNKFNVDLSVSGSYIKIIDFPTYNIDSFIFSSQANIGISALDTPITPTLATSDFTSWYAQSIKDQFYPFLRLKNSATGKMQSINKSDTSSGYRIFIFSANQSFNTIGASASRVITINRNELTKVLQASYNQTIYISSVPYDILGTAL